MVHFLPSSETLSAAYSVDREVRKREFTDKHCRRLDEREPRRVEEDVLVVLLLALVGVRRVVVKHDVEAQAKCGKEKGIPSNGYKK